MDRSAAAVWAIAAVATVLFVASFTGGGTGPWGFGMVSHTAWSYAVLLVLAAGLILVALSRPKST